MSSISNAVRPANVGPTNLPITSKKAQKTSIQSVKILHCAVVFGSPNADCRGTGICKITGTYERHILDLKKDCRLTLGQICQSPNGGVSLFFFREFLCIQLYKAHFRKGIFNMDAPCALPEHIAGGLGLEGAVLAAGRYPVVEGEGYFRIDINLD
ncbi:MAG: hypothetical protein SFV22_09545 [Saprospiraceae bacterium]|nr:hypothetical protein [Saprospiraceae bacterium]